MHDVAREDGCGRYLGGSWGDTDTWEKQTQLMVSFCHVLSMCHRDSSKQYYQMCSSSTLKNSHLGSEEV